MDKIPDHMPKSIVEELVLNEEPMVSILNVSSEESILVESVNEPLDRLLKA